jgi:hypothetical protein
MNDETAVLSNDAAARPLAIIADIFDYDSLHTALRNRREQLDISCEVVDRAAGLTRAHSSKLLAPQPIKRANWETLSFLLPALGVRLALLEDADAVAQLRKFPRRQVKTAIRAVATGRGRKRLVSKKFLRKIAPLGGQARWKQMTPKQRSKHMRQVVLRRWRKPRLTEITKQARGRPGAKTRREKTLALESGRSAL